MSMTASDVSRNKIQGILQGIELYNPKNIILLEEYLEQQRTENFYDLEANLALLKLYQFHPSYLSFTSVCQILVKALTNLPHSDFVLYKCLLNQEVLNDKNVAKIITLESYLETCRFKEFWNQLHGSPEVVRLVSGFDDAIRKFVCHIISITYQRIREETIGELLGLVDETSINKWIEKNGWTQTNSGYVVICNQDERIKSKQIAEKVDLDSVAGIMTNYF